MLKVEETEEGPTERSSECGRRFRVKFTIEDSRGFVRE